MTFGAASVSTCCLPPQSLIVKLFQTSPEAALDVCSIQGGSVKGGDHKCPDASPPLDVNCQLITNLPSVRPPPRPTPVAATSSRTAQQGTPVQRPQHRGRNSWV